MPRLRGRHYESSPGVREIEIVGEPRQNVIAELALYPVTTARPGGLEGAFVPDKHELAVEIRPPIGKRYVQAVEEPRLCPEFAAPVAGDFFVFVLDEDAGVVAVKAAAEIDEKIGGFGDLLSLKGVKIKLSLGFTMVAEPSPEIGSRYLVGSPFCLTSKIKLSMRTPICVRNQSVGLISCWANKARLVCWMSLLLRVGEIFPNFVVRRRSVWLNRPTRM